MSLTATEVKELAHAFGAPVCGIASADAFTEAPAGFGPRDVLAECESVVVIACPYPRGTLLAKSTLPYSHVRNELSTRMNGIAVDMSVVMEGHGYYALPIGSVGPVQLDPTAGKNRGVISLKHAAVLAGLGKIGKNTLLVNDRWGNMLWLNAVLTSAKLDPDGPADYGPCIAECTLCIDSCPVHALDGVSIDSRECWKRSYEMKPGQDLKINCFECRSVCPNRFGSC